MNRIYDCTLISTENKPPGFYSILELVLNCEEVVTDHTEYFNSAITAAHHFYDVPPNHPRCIARNPWEIKNEDRSQLLDPFDFYKTKRKPLKLKPRVSNKPPSVITTSWIKRDDWQQWDPEDESKLRFRAVEQEIPEKMKGIDWIDLGDSRKFVNHLELMYKMLLVQDSKFYIGSACSWSAWAKKCGVPTYITLNINELTAVRDSEAKGKKGQIGKEFIDDLLGVHR